MIKLNDKDMQWLGLHYPNLQYEEEAPRISGELDFRAFFDTRTGKLTSGLAGQKSGPGYLLEDVFEIEIRLDSDSIDGNGWPKVYEVGSRHEHIASKCNVPIIDLHFFPKDRACCLGINCARDVRFRVDTFVTNLVIPFFFRLSYTEKYGIDAAKRDLWGEYSHGGEGMREYKKEIQEISIRAAGRNKPCPCGSGRKYKKCHLGEVEGMDR